MNKYNEIMSNVTVDPEMKSRIMSAVSAAIKEQAEGSAIVTEIHKPESADMKSGSDKHVKHTKSDSESRPGVRSANPIHSDSKSAGSKRIDSKSGDSKSSDSKSADSESTENKPRRKAKRTPIVVFSSIAAAVLVLAGVAFIFSRLSNTTGARPADTSQAKSDNVAEGTVAGEIDTILDIDIHGITAGEANSEDACENEDEGGDGAANYAASTIKDVDEGPEATEAGDDDRDGGAAETTTIATTVGDYDEGIGDERIDRISRALPFDLKGNGSGVFADNITTEIFFGEGGEKVLLLTAPADVDLLAAYAPSVKTAGETITSPAGTSVTFYHIEFGNVAGLESDEIPTEVNAAYFIRGGKTYLLVFSDVQTTDVMLGVVDAV